MQPWDAPSLSGSQSSPPQNPRRVGPSTEVACELGVLKLCVSLATGAGFTFGGNVYQMDEVSRSNWMLLGVAADRSAGDPAAFPWSDIPVVAADQVHIFRTPRPPVRFGDGAVDFQIGRKH